jgi:hypothetical protein
LNAKEELLEALSGRHRAIVIAQRDVDLSSEVDNRMFVMLVAEGSLSAGGRGGGFGEKRLIGVAGFEFSHGQLSKFFETEDESMLVEFEVPYSVLRIPFVLPNGTATVGYGVVDAGLVEEFCRKAHQ